MGHPACQRAVPVLPPGPKPGTSGSAVLVAICMQIAVFCQKKEENMDMRQLKLELIRRISECEDEEILRALWKVMDIGKSPAADASPPPFARPPASNRPLDEDARDLQSDIDEVFG